MIDCPYCHSVRIRYSRVLALHLVRAMTGSEKRYCAHCEKKWRVRPRRKNVNMSFYAVAVPLAVAFSFGMLRLTDQAHQLSLRTESSVKHESSAPMALQKMGMSSEMPLLMNKDVIAKVKKLEANPQALAKLSGARRDMAEQAIKYLKSQKGR